MSLSYLCRYSNSCRFSISGNVSRVNPSIIGGKNGSVYRSVVPSVVSHCPLNPIGLWIAGCGQIHCTNTTIDLITGLININTELDKDAPSRELLQDYKSRQIIL